MIFSIGEFYFIIGLMISICVCFILSLSTKLPMYYLFIVLGIIIVVGWLLYLQILPSPPMIEQGFLNSLSIYLQQGSGGILMFGELIAASFVLLFGWWFTYIRGCF
ncbi:MAG: hypothetical protein WC516_08580 [Patescibacteria group bacterium]|jgi:hypothetical protein